MVRRSEAVWCQLSLQLLLFTSPGSVRRWQPGLVQVRGGRDDRGWHWRHPLCFHPERLGLRDVNKQIFRGRLQEGE